MPYKDPEKEKEVKRRYYEKMRNDPIYRQRKKATFKRWYQTHKAENYERGLKWGKAHKSRVNELGQMARARLKFGVLLHYTQVFNPTTTSPYCHKCRFSNIRALTLDLIIGGHNRSGLPVGDELYRYLKKKGYPEGWQTLCMNCQWIKRWTNNELH